MAEHHITSEDVVNYYSSIFGGRRQFEAMRMDSGNSERYIVIDSQHDFMSGCDDYYKMALKNVFEIHRPDLLDREHKFTPVKKLIIDEWGNEVEPPELPVTRLSDFPSRRLDAMMTEHVKEWLSPNRIM